MPNRLFDIGINDDLQSVIKKCNNNFKTLMGNIRQKSDKSNTELEEALEDEVENRRQGDINIWTELTSRIKSIVVGTTTTSQPGSNAAVVNSGTATEMILDFTIPRGPQGPQGIQGPVGSPYIFFGGRLDTQEIGIAGGGSAYTYEATQDCWVTVQFSAPITFANNEYIEVYIKPNSGTPRPIVPVYYADAYSFSINTSLMPLKAGDWMQIWNYTSQSITANIQIFAIRST